MSSIYFLSIRLFSLLSLIGFLPTAWASSSGQNVSVNFKTEACERYFLEQQAPQPFDYVVSDLEGLYLAIIEDAQNLDVSDEKAMERILKRKATFLNHFGAVISKLRYELLTKPNPKIALDQMANMLSSLGVPPNFFGIEVDSSSRVRVHPKVLAFDQKVHSQQWRQYASPPSPAIGFYPLGPKDETSLPSHMRRTIGFGPQKIEINDPPKRVGGLIQFEVDHESDLAMIVDVESGASLQVKISDLQVNGFENEDRTFYLAFNKDGSEWFVGFESKVNPDGKIGF